MTKVRGKLNWMELTVHKGQRRWRIGIVPDGEYEALFLNVDRVPGERGEVVEVEVTEDALKRARERQQE